MWPPLSGAEWGPVTGCCEHGNEPSSFTNIGLLCPPRGQTTCPKFTFKRRLLHGNGWFVLSVLYTGLKNYKNWLRRNDNHMTTCDGRKPRTTIQDIVKRSPATGPGGPRGSGYVKATDFLDVRHHEGGRSSALRTGRLYPRRNLWYSFLEAESTPGHMVPSGGATEKIPSDTIWNRSRETD